MSSLEQLKSSRVVWTANDSAHHKQAAFPFGQTDLDCALQGGIAQHGLLLFKAHTGSGELSFLLPVIQAALAKGQYIALINPPGLPNMDWFTEHLCDSERVFFIRSADNSENLWALEQCIMSGVCAVVIAWGLKGNAQQLRRCHLRASQHQCQIIWFNDPQSASSLPQSPCSAQLSLYKSQQQWYVDVLKQQGGWPHSAIPVEHPLPLSNHNINRALRAPSLSAAINT